MILCPVQSPCRILQHFGQNPDLYGDFGLAGHEGIDFTGPMPGVSVPIVSPYDAVVHEVENEQDKGYGLHVRLHCPAGDGRVRQLVFAHLRYTELKEGDRVKLGDQIAMMGGDPRMPGHGHSTGLHLHMGLRYLTEGGTVIGLNNGYKGYVDYERYLIFWSTRKEMASYPNG